LIYGIGIDLIEVSRVEKRIFGKTRFKEKVFSPEEIEYCDSFKKGRGERYAARYAAKEAFFKAIGTGYRGGIAFHEISVRNDELGKPRIFLSGKALEFAEKESLSEIHLSISHLKEIACAIVVIETSSNSSDDSRN